MPYIVSTYWFDETCDTLEQARAKAVQFVDMQWEERQYPEGHAAGAAPSMITDPLDPRAMAWNSTRVKADEMDAGQTVALPDGSTVSIGEA